MIWPTKLHAVSKAFHVAIVVNLRPLRVAWRVACLELRKLPINFRFFLNEHRVRRIESKMRRFDRTKVVFQSLHPIAKKCQDRLNLQDRSLIRNEIVQIVEKLGKAHSQGDLAHTAPDGGNQT